MEHSESLHVRSRTTCAIHRPGDDTGVPPLRARAALSLLAVAALLGAPATAQTVSWSTLFGGKDHDGLSFSSVRVTPDGDVVLATRTMSPGLPTPGGFQTRYSGPKGPSSMGLGDGFLARFDPGQSGPAQLVWATYFGGPGEDTILDVAIDARGDVTVCGATRSKPFPVTARAFQTVRSGGADGFVARFRWDRSQQRLVLVWSTLLGGSGDDTVTSLALHPSGAVVVAGQTDSADFPMSGKPFQASLAGGWDGFVAVLDASGGKVLQSTYLGGTGDDFALRGWARGTPNLWLALGARLTLDANGDPVVAGATDSIDFPTWNPYQGGNNGSTLDGVVARLDFGLRRMTYGTYLGGSATDLIWGLAMHPGGAIVVAGATGSADYPVTPTAYDPVFDPGSACGTYAEGTVTMLDPRRSGPAQLRWSTFFGGSGCDSAIVFGVDAAGRVTIGGFTHGKRDLPTTPGAHRTSLSGASDGYVALLDPHRTGAEQLVHATYFGGPNGGDEGATAGALESDGDLVLVGATRSDPFPTTPGAFQRGPGGLYDLFLARLTLLPIGSRRFGSSTPTCDGPIWQHADRWARPGEPHTRLACGAPPFASGAMFVGLRARVPYRILNVTGLLAPILFAFPATADARGLAEVSLPIPPSVPIGTAFATQWAFGIGGPCPGSGPLATSEGLLTVVGIERAGG